MSPAPEYDVLVAGGGPAGATAAALLAREGHRVLLAERSPEPRFKVGESLMPATYWTFRRLGFLDKMRASRFPQKRSVQFYTPDGRPTVPFYFHEVDPHESSQTWQVVRSEFDQMLLDHAAESGAEVRRGVSLKEPLFEGERLVGARIQAEGGRTRELTCRVLIDATGQSALLATRGGLRAIEPRLRNASFFTHYLGAERGEGIDAGATVIFHTTTRDCWFWYIPLPDERMSVGVVGPVEHLIGGRGSDPERAFAEELELCPPLKEKLARARRAEPMRAIRDFSYHSTEIAGEGWVLIGDAFGFIDPIYSTGVFLALKSAEMAADAVGAALADDDLSAARLGSFGPELRAGVEALRRLVYAFYDRDFHFAAFLRRYPEVRVELIHLLMGDVFSRPVDNLMRALESELGLAARPPAALTR